MHNQHVTLPGVLFSLNGSFISVAGELPLAIQISIALIPGFLVQVLSIRHIIIYLQSHKSHDSLHYWVEQ